MNRTSDTEEVEKTPETHRPRRQRILLTAWAHAILAALIAIAFMVSGWMGGGP